MKSRVEKHILSDFEGFKTKVKLELSKKANEKKEEDINIEDFHQLKNRVTALEQKYHDMFMEEGLDESDEYDSQEEMDNMMDDIDRAAMRERNDSDEVINEGDDADDNEKIDVSATPTTQNSDLVKNFPTPFTSPQNGSPDNLTTANETLKPLNKENNQGNEEIEKKNEINEESKNDTKNESKSEIKTDEAKVKIVNEETTKPLEKKTEEVNPDLKVAQQIIPVLKDNKSDVIESIRQIPAEEIEKPKIIDLPKDFSKDLQNDSPRSKPDKNSEEKAHPKPSRNTIEVDAPDTSHPKYARTKGSSKNDGQTLSRKNSIVSSRSGTNQGGGPNNLRNVNKKITGLQKELEGYKTALDESKQTLLDYQAELAKAYEKIAEVKNQCLEVESKRIGMEASFIKALTKKPKKTLQCQE